MLLKTSVVSVCLSTSNCLFGGSKDWTSSGGGTPKVSENTIFKKRMNSVLCADLGDRTHQKLMFGVDGDSVDVVLQETTGQVTSFVVHSEQQVEYSKTLDKFSIPGLANEHFVEKLIINMFKNQFTRDIVDDNSNIQFTEADCAHIAYVDTGQAKKVMEAWTELLASRACPFYKGIVPSLFFEQNIGGGVLAMFHDVKADVTWKDTVHQIGQKISNVLSCDDKFSHISEEYRNKLSVWFAKYDYDKDDKWTPEEYSKIDRIRIYIDNTSNYVSVRGKDFKRWRTIDFPVFAMIVVSQKNW